ncbi:MAG: DNA ligase D [Aestuariivirga sp.]|nr:DNA ligase D [Aestuariivirga sp.]
MAARAATRSGTRKKGSAALQGYAGKRDFTRTSEPGPAAAPRRAAKLSFVVQKHAARRLHFDLRLELDGVLKSWAVTRGPSMRAGVRRLAVETEDHPMAYRSWEGVIPKGEYGGGTMIVWDRGQWEAEGDAREELAKGRLTFTLKGERLKGAFSLVRMKDEGNRHNWLLIKRSDAHALKPGAAEPVEQEMTSVISGRSNEELAGGGVLRADHRARARKPAAAKPSELAKLPGARKAILPPFVAPSLAVLAPRPPQGEQWIHEIKHDGYRIEARIDGGKPKLLTRKGLDWTRRFPAVADALKALSLKAALIDGEIVSEDAGGHGSFSALQSDLKAGRHDRMVYFVFDLLHLDGVDLRGVPLGERKRLLREVIARAPTSFALRFNDHIDATGEDILGEACRLGLEGIVSKRKDLPYVSGRGEQWVKSKCMLRQEFVVVGFLPASDRRNAVGSLVLGYYEGGRLMHAGRAGTGFSASEAAALFDLLSPREAPRPKFGNTVSRPAARGVVWVRPEAVAEIEYRGRTADGLLRQAAYAGLREDKPANEVGLEREAAFIPQHEAPQRPAAPAKARFSFTHPERVLWEDAGVTKQDLGDYYSAIAPWILPHVENRVLSLLRCPGGTAGKCFFAKHAWMGLDPAIRLVDTGDEKPMMALGGLDGILALVQANVLEIHVWGSRSEDIERPDRLIFDLDPGEGVTWDDIREAARELRNRLTKFGLSSFVKTSGGKGLHVTVPLEPSLDWETAKAFTRAVAQQMAADTPRRYVASMAKNRRSGRIFIDYLRNGRGATAVAPYSTRARAGAPVAMPVDWSELSALPGPAHYTLANARQRLSKLKEDPWQELPLTRQTLNL